MRQHLRTVRASTIDCLMALIKCRSGDLITPTTVTSILSESRYLLDSKDLQMAHNTITLDSMLIETYYTSSGKGQSSGKDDGIVKAIVEDVYPKLIDLLAGECSVV